MTIQQLTYLGASITSVTGNLGWNSSPSQVSVNLVEDVSNGDNFIAPSIGGPTVFTYYGISLGGLITSWRREASTGGDPTYSVSIEDPRTILDGVQIIIDGYTGGIFNTPNLYNIFGYWESFAFGNSLVNNSGMPWKRIRDGLIALVNITPIKFGTTSYYLNISSLPAVPDYFRISGPNLSVMDFISQVCEAASHEFFFNLEDVGGQNQIKLYTVNRTSQPSLGKISTFINSQSEVVSTSTGFQLRNEVSSRFLVGGNVQSMYYQWPSALLPTTRSDDIIWPFWGVDENKNVIIGRDLTHDGTIADEFDDYHTFTIPSREVNVIGVGPKYTTNVKEMRAALAGIDVWKAYIWKESKIDGSPHFLKANHISIDPDTYWDELYSGIKPEELRALTPEDFAYLTGGFMSRSSDEVTEIHQENISRLFEYVKGYASEYYGRKFMVRLPNISAKFNPDWDGSPASVISFNIEPTDGGFIDEVFWSGAVATNLLPQDVNKLLLEDNRIVPYVRFDDSSKYDLSHLSPEDFTINTANKSLFIKCTLDDEIYFTDYSGLYSPRVVINLPGPISYKEEDGRSIGGMMTEVVKEAVDDTDPEAATAALKAMASRGGSDFITHGQAGLARIPEMVACPLKSNVDFYGPWYSVGVNAKTEFEQDPTLVPWNYGGFATMNLAANSQISAALTNMQIGEEGTLEIAGVPAFGLGDQLIAGGPYITDINVSFSNGGVTTTYTLNTWGVRNTGVQKQLVDKIQKIKINEQKIKRENREFRRSNKSISDRKLATFRKVAEISRSRGFTSTNGVIMSESILTESGTYKANTTIMPLYHLAPQVGIDYEQKTVGSLDTLFRPFTTDPTASGIPHFESYTGGEVINVDSLNPYQSGNDFLLVSKDFPEDNQQLHDASGYPKGVGLRLPLIGVGWGYDTNGNPVPNSGDIDPSGDQTVFVENHMQRMDLWKTGPVELPWDDERKVWVGGGSSLKIGVMNQNLLYRGSGVMTAWNYISSSGTEIASETDFYVHDWFLPSGGLIWSGNRVAVSKISGRYYVIASEPNC